MILLAFRRCITGLELSRVEQIYEKFKHNPPIARNMPPVAGNIAWARHLLRKIEEPMKKFQGSPTVLASKARKAIAPVCLIWPAL